MDLAAVYSSPLRRALQTAEAVAAPRGLEPVPVEALREVDVGSWQGLTRAELEARFPEQFARWLDYDQGWADGESYHELGGRGVPALLELARAHAGERVLAGEHGGAVRAGVAVGAGGTAAAGR